MEAQVSGWQYPLTVAYQCWSAGDVPCLHIALPNVKLAYQLFVDSDGRSDQTMAVVSLGLPDHEGIDPMDGTSPASQITAAGTLGSSV